ncbi:CopG family ribbon-helix-helix protein [Ignicoccus hospitalis]|uniref:Putative transcriptional regulator, CopG family n=1 Tax=Ignicoccus hospitalis (strain KIN4/I / DSM 18386 / JCM 14125) TaxID=453591 RepID=A8A8K7_IGNH4|nr:ribbon-helix-helix protein, CopG family [Ignicoccus hospitalis]ABU81259.1 putative transcriptional regulator, CopG family [Ignicoccus hospitalis KIN4/I]HIH90941.1 ribbon-helix-helix protein, CopG family [Desulfurococcaceae archaeon]
MANVRFGVALPKELAERLDEVAERLNVSRSKVIEMATSAFINYLEALEDPNKATIFVVIAPASELEKVVRALEPLEAPAFACVIMKSKYVILLINVNGQEVSVLETLRKLKGAVYPIVYPGSNGV